MELMTKNKIRKRNEFEAMLSEGFKFIDEILLKIWHKENEEFKLELLNYIQKPINQETVPLINVYHHSDNEHLYQNIQSYLEEHNLNVFNLINRDILQFIKDFKLNLNQKKEKKENIIILPEIFDNLKNEIIRDLIIILYDYRKEFPCIVLFSLKSMGSQVEDYMPSHVYSKITIKIINMSSPQKYYNTIFEYMLLNSKSPLFILGENIINSINALFLLHDTSITGFKDILKMALISHINSKAKPLASLILYFINPSKIRLNEIYKKLNEHQRDYLASKHVQNEKIFVNMIKCAIRKIANWKMAIQWIHTVAIYVKNTEYLKLRILYTNAIHPNFLTEYPIKNKLKTSFLKLDKNELKEFTIKLKDKSEGFKPYLLEEFMGQYAELNSILKLLNESEQQQQHFNRDDVSCRLSDLIIDVIYFGCDIGPEYFIGSEIFFLNDAININNQLFTSMRHNVHSNLLTLNNEILKEMHFKDVSRLYNLILLCNCGEFLNTCEIYLQFSDEIDESNLCDGICEEEKIKRFDRALICLEYMGIIKQKFKNNNDIITKLISITY